MSKILLLDLDGIVISPRHKYFSEKYSEDHGVPIEDIIPFFKNEYKKAARGEAKIRDLLPEYLKRWSWNGSLDEFLNYWFEGEKTLDENVLQLVDQLRKKGTKVYIVSDNEKERANFLMEEVGLKDKFDGAFFSYELGATKSEQSFFDKVISALKVEPPDIEYWDDDEKNVNVAKSSGIDAFLYTTFNDFKAKNEN